MEPFYLSICKSESSGRTTLYRGRPGVKNVSNIVRKTNQEEQDEDADIRWVPLGIVGGW